MWINVELMRCQALATDYDGTIASHNDVAPGTVEALERLRQSGRKLILATGRELADLLRVFPRADLFDRIVAENGALLFDPADGTERTLAPEPPRAFPDLLRELGVKPLSVGRVIVSTGEPFETVVRQAIDELGLDLQLIFNKGAVMILPSRVDKGTGLAAALNELSLTREAVVGVGDAENDHAFLEYCGCAVAVANALPGLKERADLVTELPNGAGVCWLIERIIDSPDGPAIRPLESKGRVGEQVEQEL